MTGPRTTPVDRMAMIACAVGVLLCAAATFGINTTDGPTATAYVLVGSGGALCLLAGLVGVVYRPR